MNAHLSHDDISEIDLVMLKGLDSLCFASKKLGASGYRVDPVARADGLIRKSCNLIRDQIVKRSTGGSYSEAEDWDQCRDISKPDIDKLICNFIFGRCRNCSVASIQHERITGKWPIRVNIVVSDDALLHGSYAAFIDFRDITDAYRNKLELAKACINQTNAFSVFSADARPVWKSYRNPRVPHTFWGVYLEAGEALIDLNKLAEGDIDGAVESIDQVLAPVKKLTRNPFPLAKNLVVEP